MLCDCDAALIITMKKTVCAAITLLMAEEEEEEDALLTMLCKPRGEINSIFLNRNIEGCFTTLIKRHLIDDETKFREYFRLTKNQFLDVLAYISDDIQKVPSIFVKHPISAFEMLAVTLRFLATGESFRSMAFNYRISHNHISKIVKEVLAALRKKLLPIYLPEPTKMDLKQIASEFYEQWNFPNCCGAIDGKHIRIVCPKETGTLYFNYKSYFSIVLLAIVDARCKFTWVDIGAYGKEGDSGIFQKSSIYQVIHSKEFMPEEVALPGTNIVLPHVILGDEAFKLTENVLRPYPRDHAKTDVEKRVYNYRLCRARRSSENAFGILCHTFRIFYTPIATCPSLVDDIIMVSCCLHNLLRGPRKFTLDDDINTQMPKDNMVNLRYTGGNSSAIAFQNRNDLKNYFNSEFGSVSWQMKQVTRTDIE